MTRSANIEERVTNSKSIYHGRVLNLRVDNVRLSNGRTTVREVVEHPGAVVIIPLLDAKTVILVKQYRHAIRRTLLEIPAGRMEDRESPRRCAQRELQEETGYGARKARHVFSCYVAPGYSSEILHFFLASGLKAATASPDFDESLHVKPTNLGRAFAMVRNGKIEDAKTLCALNYLLIKRPFSR